MALSQPKRGFWFASRACRLTGRRVAGLCAGPFAYELVKPLFAARAGSTRSTPRSSTCARSRAASPWQAFWLLVVAGFTPIPLKIFNLGLGHRRRAAAAVHGRHGDGRGKRGLSGRAGDSAGRHARRGGVAALYRAIGWVAVVLLVAGLGWWSGRHRAHDRDTCRSRRTNVPRHAWRACFPLRCCCASACSRRAPAPWSARR